MSCWIKFDENPEVMNDLIATDGDCFLLFDSGDICKFSDAKYPFAIVTHFKSLTADDEQKRYAAPAMYEALKACAEFIHYYDQEHNISDGKVLEQAKAALRAADGGE